MIMGNVVSSLVMYALQAAWFCQRLIDQDYRENHGSRSKPIMGIHETDLDVFLSKCRTYYLSKRSRKNWIKYQVDDGNGKLNRVHPIEGTDSSNSQWSKGADSLHFDNENFLSRKDQQVSLREGEFNGLLMDKNDLDYFLSKSFNNVTSSRRMCDSPKTERRKRKKVYYRKRYNPKGSDRVVVACGASPVTVSCAEDIQLRFCDDSSGFRMENSAVQQRTRERLVMKMENASKQEEEEEEESRRRHDSHDRRGECDNFLSFSSPGVASDVILVMKKTDSECFHLNCGNDAVEGLEFGMNRKMLMARECLT